MTMTFDQMQELIAQTLEITNRNSTAIAETRDIADQSAKDIRETKAIANSNARAVEAMLQQMSMDREERNAVLEMIAKQQKQLDRRGGCGLQIFTLQIRCGILADDGGGAFKICRAS